MPACGGTCVSVSGRRMFGVAATSVGAGAACWATTLRGGAAPPGGGRSLWLDVADRRRGELQFGCTRHRFDRRLAFLRPYFQLHAGHAVEGNAQQRRGAPGEFDQPVRRGGPAVIDPHQDLPPVLQIGELCDRGQLQGLMRGGHRRLVEQLAVRGEIGIWPTG